MFVLREVSLKNGGKNGTISQLLCLYLHFVFKSSIFFIFIFSTSATVELEMDPPAGNASSTDFTLSIDTDRDSICRMAVVDKDGLKKRDLSGTSDESEVAIGKLLSSKIAFFLFHCGGGEWLKGFRLIMGFSRKKEIAFRNTPDK